MLSSGSRSLPKILTRLTLLTLGLGSAAACTSVTIPHVVTTGTTFTLTVPSTVRFGVDPTQHPTTLLASDLQRGDGRFLLCTEGSDPLSQRCAGAQALVTRYVTRLFPDRGSPSGIAGTVSGSLLDGTPIESTIDGQTIAILDVPLATTPGSYALTYASAGVGFGELLSEIRPIQVVAGTVPAFSDIATAVGLGGVDVADSLAALVPLPQLRLQLVDAQDAADRPGAATLVIRHPSDVRFTSAFEGGVLGEGSLVRVAPGPQADTVFVHLVDPDQLTTEILLPFEFVGQAARKVPLGDFAVESQVLYRMDGVALPDSGQVPGSGNRFRVASIL